MDGRISFFDSGLEIVTNVNRYSKLDATTWKNGFGGIIYRKYQCIISHMRVFNYKAYI
jgi:hypothetical protein